MRHAWHLAMAAVALAWSGMAAAQSAPAPTLSILSDAELKAEVAAIEAGLKPGQTFVYKPVLRDGKTVAAIEYWGVERPPSSHPIDGEYVRVLEGAGGIVWGGTMLDPVVKNPHQTDGSRIEGGQTHALKPGDVFLIPAGVPHLFTITGKKLVLLGVKVPELPTP